MRCNEHFYGLAKLCGSRALGGLLAACPQKLAQEIGDPVTIWIQCALPIVVFHLSIGLFSPQQQVRHANLVIIQDHNSTSGKS